MTDIPMTAAMLVEDAQERIQNLTVEEVRAEREENDQVLLIDLRERAELFKTGTIPGALNVPRGMIEFWADPTCQYHHKAFDPRNRTILFCSLGWRSALATDVLQTMGYTNVAHLEGGFTAWQEAGLAIEPVER